MKLLNCACLLGLTSEEGRGVVVSQGHASVRVVELGASCPLQGSQTWFS